MSIPLAMLVLLSMASMTAAAQEATTGTIEGQVVDAQGLAIPGGVIVPQRRVRGHS